MSEDAIFTQVKEGIETPEAQQKANGVAHCQFAFPGYCAAISTVHYQFDDDGVERIITQERIIEIFTDMGKNVAREWSREQPQP